MLHFYCNRKSVEQIYIAPPKEKYSTHKEILVRDISDLKMENWGKTKWLLRGYGDEVKRD